MTPYSQFIHKSRYARFRDDLGRRETWEETIARYLDYFEQDLDERHSYKLSKTLRSELYDAIHSLSIMPSMRAMMTAGEAARRENCSVFNCSFTAIDTIRSFSEILYILLNGVGVGFSVERQSVSQLPPVPDTLTKTDHVIVVGDSKQGWAEAYDEFIQGLYAGHIARIDYSEIRPAGARLMTFGGRSSGPEPLRELFEFTTQIFHAARGRKLNSLECHSLCCKIGEIVVVGGVRRSALISLSNLSDQRMRDAKSGNWWMESPYLALANNSVAYTEKPEVGSFMDEWASLYRSRSGERGIFNRQGAVRKVTASGRRDPRYDFGTNPCVTGDTLILTDKGYQQIKDCVGKETVIWNGIQWSTVVPFSTGVNPLMLITMSDGTTVKCTPYHAFILQDSSRSPHYRKEAKDLNEGDKLAKFDMPVVDGTVSDYGVDAYSQGFYQGDGTKNQGRSYIYLPKMVCAPRLSGTVGEITKWGRATWKHGDMLPKGFVPLDGTVEFKLNWLAGLLDADGCVVRNIGVGIQLSSSDYDFLNDVRLMLTTIGVQAKVSFTGRESPNCMGYKCNPQFRLMINQKDTHHLISIGIIFNRLDVSSSVETKDCRRYVTISEVENLNIEEETFCFTDEHNHSGTFNGVVLGQCGEIILRSREFCNLTETVVRPDDTESSLAEKIRLASILGTFQSTQTTYQFLSDDWRRNSEEERLLGVSLTGIFNSPLMSEHGPDLRARLARLKSVAISANVDMAHQIGIPVSAAVTTVKPSGTVSQLVNSPSGIHPSHAPYYIRRVRGDNKDPLTAFLRDAGVPCEPAVGKEETTSVFSFPMQSHATKYREDISAIEHLRLIRDYNMHWSEHAVSCTVSVREHEWPSVGGWVFDHFDDLAGVSFLPFFEGDTVYPQMPYETITREAYTAMAKDMPESIPWDILATYEGGKDHTKGSQELACVAGACEIVDIS